MSKERPHPSEEAPLAAGFAFSEREQLYDRVRNGRFVRWFEDEKTTIYKIGVDSNSFGEFLFVTLARTANARKQVFTFYGLGYHDYRERWIHDEWFYYKTQLFNEQDARLSKEDAAELLDARLGELPSKLDGEHQSQRGQLFEWMADLTDDDGAYAELSDLGLWLPDWDEREGE